MVAFAMSLRRRCSAMIMSQSLRAVSVDRGKGEVCLALDPKSAALAEALRTSFLKLKSCPPHPGRVRLPLNMRRCGVYLFSEGDDHLYVGRTDRLRDRRSTRACRGHAVSMGGGRGPDQLFGMEGHGVAEEWLHRYWPIAEPLALGRWAPLPTAHRAEQRDVDAVAVHLIVQRLARHRQHCHRVAHVTLGGGQRLADQHRLESIDALRQR